jgi:hypothetical protein
MEIIAHCGSADLGAVDGRHARDRADSVRVEEERHEQEASMAGVLDPGCRTIVVCHLLE